MKLKLINRSAWPTPLLKVLGTWVCKREGLGKVHKYGIVVRGCRSQTWGGRGWTNQQRIWLDVRYIPVRGWPLKLKDHRFSWSKEEVYQNRLEVLVMLMSHEAHHATGGNPSKFRDKGGRTNAASMEFRCNAAGAKAVEDFRKEFPAIRDAIRKAMAKDRQRAGAKKRGRVDPAPKLAKAEIMLAVWQRKQRAAANRVKKYVKRVRYYSGKVAAISHG